MLLFFHSVRSTFWTCEVGVVSLPSERFTRFENPAWPWLKIANFAVICGRVVIIDSSGAIYDFLFFADAGISDIRISGARGAAPCCGKAAISECGEISLCGAAERTRP